MLAQVRSKMLITYRGKRVEEKSLRSINLVALNSMKHLGMSNVK